MFKLCLDALNLCFAWKRLHMKVNITYNFFGFLLLMIQTKITLIAFFLKLYFIRAVGINITCFLFNSSDY